MLYVEGMDIYITQGDSASVDIVFGVAEPDTPSTVTIETSDIPVDGTKIRFSVKLALDRMKCVIQKDYTIADGRVTIPLEPYDTDGLPFGDYFWDVRLFGGPDGPVTPIQPQGFHVLEVVGDDQPTGEQDGD